MHSKTVINSATQGMLAKLLATENITVHVGSYITASFDVKNRLLCLPAWNTDSKHISDLLVGHEVGHALYTPLDAIDQFKKMCPACPFAILNIVEDIRIERLIQDKYPGLISSFNSGYEKFLADDRFRLCGRDPNTLGFADRLNLKAKCGNKLNITLSPSEIAIYQRCCAAETIEDVYCICIDIYKMIENTQSASTKDKTDDACPGGDVNKDQTADDILKDNSGGDCDNSSADKEMSSPEADTNLNNDNEGNNNNQLIESNGNHQPDHDETCDDKEKFDEYRTVNDELESGTYDSLNSSLSDLYTDFGRSDPVIAPTYEQVMSTVVPVEDVIANRLSRPNYAAEFLEDSGVFKDWVRFKKESLKSIRPLITEFERKKAAFQYTRSQTSDSGDINVCKLHSYKFEDHIFKSVTRQADAKNHGMMFFIDYSMSMSSAIHNVLDHTLNLVLFCKAVSIPFVVYGFTSHGGGYTSPNYMENLPSNAPSLEKTNIFELLNSSMKKNDYELAMRHMRAQSYKRVFLNMSYTSLISKWEYLRGTPLNETLICAHHLVKSFKKRHCIEKMNVMILSDGASQPMLYGKDLGKVNSNIRQSSHGLFQTRYLMNLNGREVSLSDNSHHNYAVLLENLKITCGCVTVGFFINSSNIQIESSAVGSIKYSRALGWSDAAPGYTMTASNRVTEAMRHINKDQFIFIRDGYNYDGYFLINTRNMSNIKNTEFSPDVSLDKLTKDSISKSTQNRLATEFGRFSSDKKSSRLILTKFAEIIS